jgi:acyl-ACP thioesterase
VAIYRSAFVVQAHEADARGAASVGTLCRYLQDIAALHASAIGYGFEDMQSQSYLWVLSRLTLEIDRFPRWGEQVEIETWPSGTDRLFALRDWIIYAAGTERELLGRATSAWVVLSSEHRTPVRVEKVSGRMDVIEERRAIAATPPKLPALDSASWSRPVEAGFSDLDLNGHINNVRYVEWLIDALPLEHLMSRRLKRLEVNFLGEGGARDRVLVQAAPHGAALSGETAAEAAEFLHSAQRIGDGSTLCRARTLWIPG